MKSVPLLKRTRLHGVLLLLIKGGEILKYNEMVKELKNGHPMSIAYWEIWGDYGYVFLMSKKEQLSPYEVEENVPYLPPISQLDGSDIFIRDTRQDTYEYDWQPTEEDLKANDWHALFVPNRMTSR